MRRCGHCLVVVALASPVFGQSPPQPLPQSITGAATTPPSAISPASGVVPAPVAPIARFQNLQSYPQETVAAVYSVRSGVDWLWRMNQPNGRFFPGLNPAVRLAVEGDTDFRQALAAFALADTAKFTGDERFAARAAQAVLSLLAVTRPDPADPACRVPVISSDRCNRVGFAAALALAIYALPSPDANLTAQADALCAFLVKQCRPNGAIHYVDDPAADAMTADPAGLTVYPGMAIRALTACDRLRPNAANRAVVARSIVFYRDVFKARPCLSFAATLLPGVAEFALLTGKDATMTAIAFELADWLCGQQYGRDARNPLWIGGFKPGADAEPGFGSAACADALAAATKLTRAVPDLTRFRKYRAATVDGLTFARLLQFTDDSAEHFEKAYRTRFLTGGVHLAPSDGTVRADATAALVSAQLAFLQSGAEGRAD